MEIDLDELQSLVAWAGERGAETGREESPFSIHHSPIELIGELVRKVKVPQERIPLGRRQFGNRQPLWAYEAVR